MEYSKIKLGIIGGGRWGFNHIKTAASLLKPEDITVCDTNSSVAAKLKTISPEIKFSTRLNEILSDDEINAVVISSPAETHFEIARKCLENNKNILVEKPLTLKLEDANYLVNLAEENGLKLMVGHVLLYHPAILKIKEIISGNSIGKLQYIYSNRLNLGTVRKEENILWSFAPHDISVIQYLIEQMPVEIVARGENILQDGIEDTTLTYLKYKENIGAHIYVSWLHPFKEQRLVVICEKGVLVFEDGIKEEKLKFYPKGFIKIDGHILKFDGEYQAISIDNTPPLLAEQKDFFDSVLSGNIPRTDGKSSIAVLEILVKASTSLKEQKLAVSSEQTIKI